MDKLILGIFVFCYLSLFIYYECYKSFFQKVVDLFWPPQVNPSRPEDKSGTKWKIVSSSVKTKKPKKSKTKQ